MFLRNGWYAASWSKDLTTKPVARTFLNDKVVLYRGEDGTPAALEDRCCHRAAPLSIGEVVGRDLMCGYHGLKFAPDGRCTDIPGQREIPDRARVRGYPVHEKQNVVWIWMGDPAKADPAKIEELPWLDSPEWTATPGYLHVKSSYLLLIDNLLDLTHVAYVHKKTIAGDPREATTPTRTERVENGIRNGRWMIDFVPPPLFAKAGNFTSNVDRWQHVTWKAPATVYLDVGCAKTGTGAPQGDRSQGISIWSTHLVTPETETSCHYMFGFARNFKLQDEAMSKLLYEGSKTTFMEDLEVLELQQQNVDGGSIDGMVDIQNDAAQLQMRRMMRQLMAEEGRIAAE
jgi:phenylpropionate dioxygenase-like ring-hydroxylating dioxygenase large terminal subunit